MTPQASRLQQHYRGRIVVQFNVPFERCCGLGFDGASNMRGAFQGAQAVLKKEFPSARYQHCTNHRLDLCLQEVAKEEVIIREFLELVRKMSTFVKNLGND